MATIRSRFLVVSKTSRKSVDDLVLRATKQSDAANTENPVLWRDADSPNCEIHLRIFRDQAVPIFFKGKEVYVDFTGPV